MQTISVSYAVSILQAGGTVWLHHDPAWACGVARVSVSKRAARHFLASCLRKLGGDGYYI